MKEIQLLIHIFYLSKNINQIPQAQLLELGSKKEILTSCRRLHKKGLITCENISVLPECKDGNNWSDFSSVSLLPKGKETINRIKSSVL